MPTIINPYKSGSTMGEDLFGLGGLADAFFGPKATQSAYTREKFKEAERQNLNLPLYADAMAKGGDPGNIARLGILSGQTGADVGNYGRYVTVNRNPNALESGPVTASIIGAGGAASSTPQYTTADMNMRRDLDLEKTRRLIEADRLKNERELIQVHAPVSPENPTGYSTITRAEFLANPGKYIQVAPSDINKSAVATGLLPGATPEQKAAYAGMSQPKAEGDNFFILRNGQVFDRGITRDKGATRHDGSPIVLEPGDKIQLVSPSNPSSIDALGTAPGKTEQKDHRTAVNNANSTLALGQQILDVVNKNPTAIGAVGNLRRMGQEGVDLLNSLNTMFGTGRPGDYERTVAQTRADMQRRFGAGALALIPELFDDDLNSIQTMNGMLLYKAAAAMGQSGRDASDKDIAAMRQYIGSPDSWFQGPNTYRSKVGSLMRIVQQQRDADNAMIQPGAQVAPNAVTAPPSTGASTRTAPPASNPIVDDLVRKYLPPGGSP